MQAHTSIRRLFDWLGRFELTTLALIGLVAAGLWGFVELSDEVLERETHAMDRAVLMAMRTASDPSDPLGPPWVEEMMRDMTAFGGTTWLAMLTAAALGYLALLRQGRTLAFVALCVISGWVLSTALKSLFDRPRPDLVPHGSYVYNASFPSGHSMMAAVTYLTLAALVARIQSRRRIKAYLLSVALLLTVLTGISRVYLGVHWPTDVLAGWTLGATWAMICWLGARWLQQRGRIEAEQ